MEYDDYDRPEFNLPIKFRERKCKAPWCRRINLEGRNEFEDRKALWDYVNTFYSWELSPKMAKYYCSKHRDLTEEELAEYERAEAREYTKRKIVEFDRADETQLKTTMMDDEKHEMLWYYDDEHEEFRKFHWKEFGVCMKCNASYAAPLRYFFGCRYICPLCCVRHLESL